MSAETFTCENCGGTWPKGWSDEEMLAESASIFPGLASADAAIVCDDCYKDIMGWAVDEGLLPEAPSA